MAEPGWYPDPSASPGRFRYWDGERWAAESVADPNRRRRIIVIGSVLALAVVIMGALVIIFRPDHNPVGTPPPVIASGPSRSSTAGSPTPGSRTTSTASDAASPTSAGSTPTAKPPVTRCPDGEPTRTVDHPSDGRVHGGALSFQPISGSGFGKPDVLDHFGWWYDEHGQQAKITDDDTGSVWPQWIAVGTVAIQPGFQTPQQAAELSTRCAISAGDYRGYTDSKTISSAKITIDGQDAWKTITEVSVAGRAMKGDQITVIVVNAGPPGSYSIFLGTAPIGDPDRTKIISTAVSGLRVDG
ncbi:DUF2510 domain-containing protein [Microlunatus elymi]|uniref:DUF2510 domain-containing protein n=1 Tax=Microlunatus elymi TaxID=2596828 RepID=A0A516Q2X8_9ACTN|nr:DUF2510 domain-containing protein [Microlunatus elymi]QDP97784.1 DUF2510 domain-containing protein [Microlunatus elymi]